MGIVSVDKKDFKDYSLIYEETANPGARLNF